MPKKSIIDLPYTKPIPEGIEVSGMTEQQEPSFIKHMEATVELSKLIMCDVDILDSYDPHFNIDKSTVLRFILENKDQLKYILNKMK